MPACFLGVCDRHLPPARGDFPNALAPVSNPAGIRVGRLVPSDRSGRPAGAQDVTPSRGQAPQTSGHKGLSSRLSSRKSRRSLSQVWRVGISFGGPRGTCTFGTCPGWGKPSAWNLGWADFSGTRTEGTCPSAEPCPIKSEPTPSPLGEGGAHAPGEGEIPVLAGNREDLAIPLIRRFAAPCM